MQHAGNLELLLNKHHSKQKPTPTIAHDLHIGQEVMYQDSVTKRWFLATIKTLCPEPRSYQILTTKGVFSRRTHNHLKPYKSCQKTQKGEQVNQNNVDNSDNLQQSHPKRQIKM